MSQTFTPFSSKDFGTILIFIYQGLFPDEALKDPDNSFIGGTPFYTYLNLLDKWYLMGKNKNLEAVFQTFNLKNIQERYGALVSFRSIVMQYTEKKKKKLMMKKIQNHQDAIMAIIDLEFIELNVNDPKGKDFLSQREKFIALEIPSIESAYMYKRGIGIID